MSRISDHANRIDDRSGQAAFRSFSDDFNVFCGSSVGSIDDTNISAAFGYPVENLGNIGAQAEFAGSIQLIIDAQKRSVLPEHIVQQVRWPDHR